MFFNICLLILSTFVFSFSEGAGGYGYPVGFTNGPDTWATNFPDYCNGNAQSPIDIPYDGVTKRRDWLPFQLLNYEIDPYKMYIANNGHTAVVTFTPRNCKKIPTVVQGNLPGVFELAQFHFHWGDGNGGKGSEHTLFGKQFDAELHFVHYNTKCGRDLGEAIANCQGTEALAVLGVFMEAGGSDNHAYDSIIDGLRNVKAQGSSAEIKAFDMSKLFPHDLDEFFRYEGGLTTPTCNEIVTWTVFKNYVKLSHSQMKMFYELMTDHGGVEATPVPLVLNFRPVEPLNGRTVYYADLKLRCDHRDWTKCHNCQIYYKETDDELDFMESIHSCIGYHYSETPYQGLIPVGRLRCLRNRFSYTNNDDICGRFFRVNAIKDNQGVWREYPSGNRVLFHHFPDFDQKHGGHGDTLVWDAFLNRLFIQDEHDHYNALCFRDYQNSCEECDGFENGHICSNAGDCINNQCQCDGEFMGYSCQLGPIPDKEVVIVGASSGTHVTTSLDTLAGTECSIASYNTATTTTTDQVCDYVFGKGMCCSGILDNAASPMESTNVCMYYDCFTDTWVPVTDIPAKLLCHRGNVIKHKGRDYKWLIAGGLIETSSGARSKAMYWLDEDMTWETVPDEMEEPRIDHCQVQINDCEIAFIGGCRGDDTSACSDVTASDVVDIWNYKERTWRTGPNLKTGINKPACGVLMDRTDYHKVVVIGCGESFTVPSYLQVWNLATNMIYNTMFECPDADGNTQTDAGHFKELDDSYLVFTNAAGHAYTFNLETGFSESTNLTNSGGMHTGGDSFVADRGTTKCV